MPPLHLPQLALFALLASFAVHAATDSAPTLDREFRAAWVATVYNIDWPSKAGVDPDAQRAELRNLFQVAQDTGLNAIIFQIRPAADALYESAYEPWSPHLTGKMDLDPGYDPLSFAIEEAHFRGMELHAWFNPFRAQTNIKKERSANHIANTRADWVKQYGNYLWLDPGNPEVRDYTIKIMLDVVKRYDIDGVHIDDYFYPYPYPSNEDSLPFPDDDTFQRFGRGKKDTWRRSNVNRFVETLYKRIKKEKPWVKFGISPFGIWRPGTPKGTEAGLDAYNLLYADARKWLHKGWIDYMMPQLYWSIDSEGQSFPRLLDWWVSENKKNRHLWPGIATDRVGDQRPASEMTKQIDLIRKIKKGYPGHAHWSADSVIKNQKGVQTLLKKKTYAALAIVPPSKWLGSKAPAKPTLLLTPRGDRLILQLAPQENIRFWLLQTKTNKGWKSQLLDGTQDTFELELTDAIAVSALGYTGLLSKKARYEFE